MKPRTAAMIAAPAAPAPYRPYGAVLRGYRLLAVLRLRRTAP